MTSEGIEEIDERFKALVVATILESRTRVAIRMLCERYGVKEMKLAATGTKGKAGKGPPALKSREIRVLREVETNNPPEILRAFYSYLLTSRQRNKRHGTARQFVGDYLTAYERVLTRLATKSSGHAASGH